MFAVGNGEEILIYDGRRSPSDCLSQPSASHVISDTQVAPGKGEIHYLRDSDDEQPDSDEDPDDDLDI